MRINPNGIGLLFICLLMHLPVLLHAQEFLVKGRVSDSVTSAPLAFVNIVINDGQQGGVTDIDGRFSLMSREPVHSLRLSYVGYRPLELTGISGFQQVRMAPLGFDLPEVLIEAGENPAHRIIRNAVANRKANNPDNIPCFTFTSYDKMYFTVNADSIRNRDSLPQGSPTRKLMEFLENQHIFLMESVAEHQYIAPDRSRDEIIATRVSGLKDPLVVFLISSMQSASFYGDLIDIAGYNYINPVSRNSEQRYLFSLRDTLYSETPGDTTFVIAYKPRPNRNFDGLKGLLYISNSGWAIRNVIAEPARPDDKLQVRIRQMYEFLDNRYWFPVQLETEIVFNTLNFSGAKPFGIGKSYRYDIVFDTVLSRRKVGNIAIELAPGATGRSEEFWSRHRSDSLTLKELNTYRIIDSIGRANHFDRRIKGLSALISGRISLGYADIDVNRLLRYSKHEGWHFGLGLYTGSRLSQRFKAGGYMGYGLRDQQFKYGASLDLKLQRHGNVVLNLNYSEDREESAGIQFFDDQSSILDPFYFRDFYVDRMEMTQKSGAMLSFRMLKYIWAGTGMAAEYKRPRYEYAFSRGSNGLSVLTGNHTFGKIIAGMRFAWGEKFIRDQQSQMTLGTKYPVVWLQYTAARKGLFGGEFEYNRVDFRMNWSFYTRFVGNTEIWLMGSYIDKPAPLSEMIGGWGSAGSGFSLFSPGSFSTMRPGEFLNDRFAAIFINHSFGRLLFHSQHFAPEPALIFNVGAGSLRNPERHRYVEFKTMEKGYAEAGIALNNILKTPFYGIGVAALYRGGAYSYDRFGKNLAGRISVTYSF